MHTMRGRVVGERFRPPVEPARVVAGRAPTTVVASFHKVSMFSIIIIRFMIYNLVQVIFMYLFIYLLIYLLNKKVLFQLFY